MVALLSVAPRLPSLRLGERLIAAGRLTRGQLQSVLAHQAARGGKLGHALLHQGLVREAELQATLAEQLGLSFLPLGGWQAEAALLHPEQLEAYLRLGMLPLRRETDGSLSFAVLEPTEAANAWAGEHFPHRPHHWHLTTRRDLHAELKRLFGPKLIEEAVGRVGLLFGWHETARRTLLRGQRRMLWLLLGVVLLAAHFAPHGTMMVGWWTLQAAFSATLAFKVWLLAIGLAHRPKVSRLRGWKTGEWHTMPEADLPVYTLLVPMYREAAIAPYLIRRLCALHYPPEKLDIKLIVEADDQETQEALKAALPPPCMEIIVVPPSLPRTKPKACNYALPFARGTLITIYDAEDAPAPDQLRLSAWAFAQLPPRVACMQASLHYYNRHQNLLTRCFSLEYALWFEGLLPGLESGGFPIPLGGTSNHLRRSALDQVGGWDAFNVTEDADLGLRLLRHGFETRLLPSVTLEEAPGSLKTWLPQRTRWIKGYMQTWCVHLRLPGREWRRLGVRHFIGFHCFIGGPCLQYLATPVLVVGTLLMLGTGTALTAAHILATLALFLSSAFLHGAAGLMMLYRLPQLPHGAGMRRGMALACLVFPFYFFLHSFAAMRALAQLFRRPHLWEKSPHGLAPERFALPPAPPAHEQRLTAPR